MNQPDIFSRLLSGEMIQLTDPKFPKINDIVAQTMRLSAQLNSTGEIASIRQILAEITGSEIDESTTIFAPFYTNFGRLFESVKPIYQPCLLIP